MKLKQISVACILPALVASIGFASLTTVSDVSAAAKPCEALYSTSPQASDDAKAKAVQLLRACKKGYDTDKCEGFSNGSQATKQQKEVACQKGRDYRAENPPQDDNGEATEGGNETDDGTVLNDPVAGDDCGGVKTAIIKCTQNNQDGSVENNGIWGLLLIVINVMTAGVGVLAVAGIVYGAIMYTTAEDKADQVKKATDIITNVIIGLIAFALLWAGLNFIIPGGVFK